MNRNCFNCHTDFSMNVMPPMVFPRVDFQQWHFNLPFLSFPFFNQGFTFPNNSFNFSFPTFPFLNQGFTFPNNNFNFSFPTFPFLNQSATLPKNNVDFNFSSTPSNRCSNSFDLKSNNNYGDVFVKTTKTNFNFSDYDARAGKKLAQIALRDSVGFTGQCATYVKKAIQKANLGDYKYGDAYKMTSILKNNSNFKEVSPNSVNVKDLPAGCVLVYNKGKEGYSQKYGHTEITTGDGRAVSDGITKNLHKQPSAVFIPVSSMA